MNAVPVSNTGIEGDVSFQEILSSCLDNGHLLEAALQGGIFLNGLLELVDTCGTNTPELPSTQCRLQQRTPIHHGTLVHRGKGKVT